MNPRLTALSLAFALGLVGGCAPAAPPAPDTEAMIAEADALDERFLAAFNAGDTEALAALYWNSPEAVSMPPDTMVIRGTELQTGSAATLAAMHEAGASLTITESHQLVVGEAVIGWGLWTVTMNGPEGMPVEVQGRYTDVKAERDGVWVYLVDHASVPLPPPPAPEN
jgi:ketosteroid isomerase-like protein